MPICGSLRENMGPVFCLQLTFHLLKIKQNTVYFNECKFNSTGCFKPLGHLWDSACCELILKLMRSQKKGFYRIPNLLLDEKQLD